MRLLTLLREIVFEPELGSGHLEQRRNKRREWYKEVFTPTVNEYLARVSEIMGRDFAYRDSIKNGISVKYWFSKLDNAHRAVEYIQANPEITVGDSVIRVKPKLISRGALRVFFTSDRIDRAADKAVTNLRKQYKDL